MNGKESKQQRNSHRPNRSRTGSVKKDGGAHGGSKVNNDSRERATSFDSTIMTRSRNSQSDGINSESEYKESLQCTTCMENFVSETDNLIECDRCREWTCQTCAGLTDHTYAALQSQGDQITWYCIQCKEKAHTDVKMGNIIEKKCLAMDQKIELYKKEMEEKLGRELKQVHEEIQEIKETIKNQDNSINVSTSSAAKQGVQEMSDREFRKLNLVIFNIPESPEEEKEKQDEHDKDHLDSIKEVLQVTIPFAKATRLGHRKPSYTRPVRITLRNEDDKTAIFKGASNLKNHVKYGGISIAKDLTPLEREEMRVLVKMKQDKNREAEDNGDSAKWVIRNGKLIDISRKAPRSQPDRQANSGAPAKKE